MYLQLESLDGQNNRIAGLSPIRDPKPELGDTPYIKVSSPVTGDTKVMAISLGSSSGSLTSKRFEGRSFFVPLANRSKAPRRSSMKGTSFFGRTLICKIFYKS